MYALSPGQHFTKLDNDENIENYWEFLKIKPTCFGDDIIWLQPPSLHDQHLIPGDALQADLMNMNIMVWCFL